ncbi:MAG: peptidoglycan-binding protein [Bifidobacteriaceae bacterium]|jgi:peptidoglycan hydrolase-like protein with peptidoglycan-binding domain|nr:peptidoglycan-binding protein [Bifidobacteriaceae bacterium]
MSSQITRKIVAGLLGLALIPTVSSMASAIETPVAQALPVSATTVVEDDAVAFAAQPWCANYLTTRGDSVSFVIFVPAISSGDTAANRKCVLTTAVSGAFYVGTGVLQQSLAQCEGQTGVKFDSYYGGVTGGGVSNVQGKHHLTQDGKYGPATHNKMLHIKKGGGGCARDYTKVSL